MTPKLLKHFLCLLAVLILSVGILTACTPASALPAESGTPTAVSNPAYVGKKVFWVDSYHQGYEWSDGIENGIRSVLDGTGVELKVFRMDTSRNPDGCKAAGEQAHQEIKAFGPQVVIATDDNAQKCLVVPYLKGTVLPVVFAGVNWTADPYGYPAENVTGMIEVDLVEEAIALVESYAKGKRIGFISIDTTSSRKNADAYKERFFGDQMTVYWAKTQQEFKDAFLTAQAENDILIVSNNAGAPDWNDEQMQQFMLSYTAIPTLSLNPWMSSYVLVDLSKKPEEQGEWAARAALKILSGTPISEIPVEQNKKGRLILNLALAEKLNIIFPPAMLKNAETIE